MKEIQLTQSQIALVDDEDYDYLSQFEWYAIKSRNTYYARRNEKRDGVWVHINMHQELMNNPEGMKIDHKDGNGLNNTRHNLRSCTNIQNLYNRGKGKNNTSGFKGVSFFSPTGKWVAQIQVNHKHLHLGYFNDPKEAAQAYNDAALMYHGDYARINVI